MKDFRRRHPFSNFMSVIIVSCFATCIGACFFGLMFALFSPGSSSTSETASFGWLSNAILMGLLGGHVVLIFAVSGIIREYLGVRLTLAFFCGGICGLMLVGFYGVTGVFRWDISIFLRLCLFFLAGGFIGIVANVATRQRIAATHEDDRDVGSREDWRIKEGNH